MRVRSKYAIWDTDRLVPAWTRRPNDARAVPLRATMLEERNLSLRWFIPAHKLAATSLLLGPQLR